MASKNERKKRREKTEQNEIQIDGLSLSGPRPERERDPGTRGRKKDVSGCFPRSKKVEKVLEINMLT